MNTNVTWILATAATLTWAPLPLAARQAPPPNAPAAGARGGLDELAFLAGCWAGRMGSLEVREQWSEAEAGVMLWTTRFFSDGRLVDFEFGMLRLEGGVPVLWPYPQGERSSHGFALVSSEGEHVFENLEHDFPVRIVYARDGARGLLPRIEGRDGSARSWALSRVDCPDGS